MRTEPIPSEVTPDGSLIVRGRPPAPRPPARIDLTTPTRGERVILVRPDGYVFDLRATSDPFLDADGRLRVHIVTEAAWYAWQITGTPPDPVEVLAAVVFVERPLAAPD